MDALNSWALMLGGSWASGVNLYMTTAGLGIAHRMGWVTLPGNLESISHPLVIGVAIALYAVEFIVDKIPFLDSAWDSVHTLIRPLAASAMGYMAGADTGPLVQYPLALLTGSIAMDSHLTKATTRAAINTSPEPVTNTVASVTEDASVAGVLYLIIKHPIIASLAVIAFIAFSVWFLKKMFHFIRRIFNRGKQEQPKPQGGET